MILKTHLTTCGFKVQMKWRSLLTPPAGQKKDSSWDFFQDGRIAFLYEDVESAMDNQAGGPNIFLEKSDLCHRMCLQGSIALLDVGDMHQLHEADTWFSPAAKAAQRGPAFHEAVMNALLCTPPKGDSPGAPWVTVHDHVDVVEMHPHLGDGAVSSHRLMNNVRFPCTIRHFIAQLGYKFVKEFADYTLKRITQMLEQEWCDGQGTLYTFEKVSESLCVKTPVRATATVFVPAQSDLIAIPGCHEAYLGITKLEFQVCRVAATGHIKIVPEKSQQFHGASDLIKSEARALEENHTREFEHLLIDMMTDQGTNQDNIGEDPRPHEPEIDPEDEEGTNGFKGQTFKSEEDLKKNGIEIQAEAKMHGLHSVKMLRDKANRIWLVAAGDNVTVPRWTIVGSYGSGRWRDIPEDAMTDGQGHY